ncbi:selenocysteine lyase-like [Diadema antillarum]|uniref:selenocysteine lyase-like n=1 Tax=Diadema antillarum TaxID=105358 RepID=UPI003A866FC1
MASDSTKSKVYLDYNATTPLEPAVVEAVTNALTEAWGNPSSSYPQGQLAKQVINKARAQVAGMIGASPGDIIFTSGGTEANNLVIHTAITHFKTCHHGDGNANGDAGRPHKPHIITTNLEHDSIKLPLEHLIKEGIADVTFVQASTKTGRVEVEAVMDAIRPATCLITIMHANNEIGVIQPVTEIFERVREEQKSHRGRKILLHTDAAQTIGKIEVNVSDLNVDYLTIVGHKFYGPRIGALYVKGGGADPPIYPMLFGGGQERNLRPGTENTGMIAGLGKAAELVTENIGKYESGMRAVRDYLEKSLLSAFGDTIHINGKFEGSQRIPNTCNVSFMGKNCQGRKLLSMATSLQASVGAACHSHSGDRPSHILLAIGVPYDIATNALRLSVGRGTTFADIDRVVSDLKDVLKSIDAENGNS